LYEKKVLSYLRTGSRYISANVLDKIPHLIATLKNHPRFGAYAAGMDNIVLNIRSVNDKKVIDHLTRYRVKWSILFLLFL
jgi:DNA topoisomerase-3